MAASLDGVRAKAKPCIIIGEERVVTMMLQMDKCCSFNLPIRHVVFNRIREVDFDAYDRYLC